MGIIYYLLCFVRRMNAYLMNQQHIISLPPGIVQPNMVFRQGALMLGSDSSANAGSVNTHSIIPKQGHLLPVRTLTSAL